MEAGQPALERRGGDPARHVEAAEGEGIGAGAVAAGIEGHGGGEADGTYRVPDPAVPYPIWIGKESGADPDVSLDGVAAFHEVGLEFRGGEPREDAVAVRVGTDLHPDRRGGEDRRPSVGAVAARYRFGRGAAQGGEDRIAVAPQLVQPDLLLGGGAPPLDRGMVPPKGGVAPRCFAHDEEGCGEPEIPKHRHGEFEDAAIGVVEGKGHGAAERTVGPHPGRHLAERDHRISATEPPHLFAETIHGEMEAGLAGLRSVAGPHHIVVAEDHPTRSESTGKRRYPRCTEPGIAEGGKHGNCSHRRLMRPVAKFRPMATRLLAGCLLLGGCGDSPPTAPSSMDEEFVHLSPEQLELIAGASYPLAIEAQDKNGISLPPTRIKWTSSNTGVAIADVNGRVTARGAGIATITASFGAVADATRVTVLPGRTQSVAIQPSSVTLPVDGVTTLLAVAYDAGGLPIDGITASWWSENISVANVDVAGRVTGIREGVTTVYAMIDGVRGAARIDVTSEHSTEVATVAITPVSRTIRIGDRVQYFAVARNPAGETLEGLPVAWNTADPLVATIDAQGTVLALAPGWTHLTATIGGVVGTAVVYVAGDTPPSGPWPNEPAGFTNLADQPWSALGGVWELLWGTAHLQLDPTAPGSPPSTLQVDFPVGFVGGEAPGTEAVGLPAVRQVYVGIWWMASNPWQGHPSNSNKVQYLFTGEDGSMAMIMYGPPQGPFEMRVFPDWHGQWLTPNVADVKVTLGQWHRIEWLVAYGPSNDPPSGIVRWWMDGVLIGDYANVRLSSTPLIQYKMAPVWGGAERVAKHQNDFFRYDHIRISGR
jgi:uncharacterized protein YjdB